MNNNSYKITVNNRTRVYTAFFYTYFIYFLLQTSVCSLR